MKTKKHAIGWRHWISSDHGYRFLTVEVYPGSIQDMVSRLKSSYRDEMDYHVKQIRLIKEKTGDTIYFDGNRDSMIEFRFQSDHSEEYGSPEFDHWRDWYGCHVKLDIDPNSMALLRKLTSKKAIGDRQYLDSFDLLFSALENLGAVHIKHENDLCYRAWLIDDTPELAETHASKYQERKPSYA